MILRTRRSIVPTFLTTLLLTLPTVAQLLTFAPYPAATPTPSPGTSQKALLPECAHQCAPLYAAQFDCLSSDPSKVPNVENWICFCEHPQLRRIMSLTSQGMTGGECDTVCLDAQDREDVANFVWDNCGPIVEQKNNIEKNAKKAEEEKKKKEEEEEKERQRKNRESLDAKERENEGKNKSGDDPWINKAWPFLLLALLLVLLPIAAIMTFRYFRRRPRDGVFTPLPMYQSPNTSEDPGRAGTQQSLTRRITSLLSPRLSGPNNGEMGTIPEHAPILPSLSVLRRDREERERRYGSGHIRTDSGASLDPSTSGMNYYQSPLKPKLSAVSSMTEGSSDSNQGPSGGGYVVSPMTSTRSRYPPPPIRTGLYGSSIAEDAVSEVSDIDIAEQTIAEMASPGPLSPLRVVNPDSSHVDIPELELESDEVEVEEGGIAGLAGVVAKRWSDGVVDVDESGHLVANSSGETLNGGSPLTPPDAAIGGVGNGRDDGRNPEEPRKMLTRQWSWEADTSDESTFTGISRRSLRSTPSFTPHSLVPITPPENRNPISVPPIKIFAPSTDRPDRLSRSSTSTTSSSLYDTNPLSPVLLNSPLFSNYSNPAMQPVPKPIQTGIMDSPTLPHHLPIGTPPRRASETSFLHSPPPSSPDDDDEDTNPSESGGNYAYFYTPASPNAPPYVPTSSTFQPTAIPTALGQYNRPSFNFSTNTDPYARTSSVYSRDIIDEYDSGEDEVDDKLTRFRMEQERELEGMLGMPPPPATSSGFYGGPRRGRLGTVREVDGE
ncbi:hypothetical protein BJ508DRAFT_373921 [Ascobolus immersus RN42]|uniref:Extracellular membrane protein CFEM domain-containing protein n=1 Tax=Ascobolus immersus RN42 TaxID=1160509 RepID=A0A3N4IL49_ASCIM|nr:hypothetical protein BJ508DRAFT_373921 [Ascobolus immersus RN42]